MFKVMQNNYIKGTYVPLQHIFQCMCSYNTFIENGIKRSYNMLYVTVLLKIINDSR